MSKSETLALSIDLDEQILHAKKIFTDLAKDDGLKKLLKGCKSWAIVGGSVRDTILTPSKGYLKLKIYWPDVDIAVSHAPGKRGGVQYDIITLLHHRASKKWPTSRNHFGGLKVKVEDLGSIDIWACSEQETFELKQWKAYLSTIDFGLNAVAFVWPLGEIIMHPSWKSDLHGLKVERLSDRIMQREIQAIRAIALLDKLSQNLNTDLKIGAKVKKDLIWLITEANKTELDHAYRYFLDKLLSKRWPLSALYRFEKVLELSTRSRKANSILASVDFQESRDLFNKSLTKNYLRGEESFQS